MTTGRSMWTHFEGLRTKLLLTTFYDLLTRHFKKPRKSDVFEIWTNVKYVFSNIAERRRSWASTPAIDRYILPAGAQQQTRQLAIVAAVDRLVRQAIGRTDRRTLDRSINPAPHTMRAASITGQVRLCSRLKLIMNLQLSQVNNIPPHLKHAATSPRLNSVKSSPLQA